MVKGIYMADDSSDYLPQDQFIQNLKDLGYLPQDPISSNDPEGGVTEAAAGTASPEEQAMLEAAQVKPGYDGSPDANPNVPVPVDTESTGGTSPAPSSVSPTSSDLSNDANAPAPSASSLPDFSSLANKSTPVPSVTSLSSNPQLNDTALQNAQQQAAAGKLVAGLGNAFATAAAAPTGKGPNEEFFKQQMENANQPVTNLDQRRQLFERNVLVAGQTADAAIKQMSAQQQAQLNDPNSSSSQFIKSLLASQYSQQTDAQGNKVDITKSPGWDNLSGSDALDFQKMIASQEHLQSLRDQLQFRNQLNQQKVDTHSSDKEQAATQKLSAALNTFRGDIAAQQANVGLVNSDKAMALINSSPNLNDLTPQQDSLLRQEVAKIATGGAATEASTKDLQANTLQARAANFWQNVSGNPTGAQLGDFIQKNKDYLQHLNDVNHNYVDTKRQNILNDYKGQISDDKLSDFQQRYVPNRTAGAGNMPAAPSQGAANPNFTPDVLQYAQQHNITPDQALSIKQQRTAGGQ